MNKINATTKERLCKIHYTKRIRSRNIQRRKTRLTGDNSGGKAATEEAETTTLKNIKSRTVMVVMADNVMWHSVGHRLCNSNAHHQPLPLGASQQQASSAIASTSSRAGDEESISGYALSPQYFGGTPNQLQLQLQHQQQHDCLVSEVVL
ncbi:Hypothetical predicted protein [Drosophila guanche]|uniref:Uncharacterized protein n=1 Tax=Drosophila guanche TaxID=7266 RepID=A0A3B0J5X9_DROGU|nr:Hypothetical predicted protein [Drosophila guanche]